ncbi:MAG: phosphate ABC transporter substrate-binding protein PstS family protein [Bacillota bacterium]
MKKGLLVFSIIMVLALVFSQFAMAREAEAAAISVLVDGKKLAMEKAPLMEQGRVLVPMRGVFEALEASVSWDSKTQTVTAKKDSIAIILKAGQKSATVSNRTVTLDVPAKVISGTTYVPMRFVSEALGATVNWNAASSQVIVNSFVAGALPKTLPAGSIKISGSTSVQPLAQELAEAFMKKYPNVKISIAGGGSSVGVKDVAEGRVNIGNASRALKSSDPADVVGTTIAKDAVVVIVNPKNPVSKLTKEQVKEIYTGKITNWKDVGGNNAPIIVHARDAASGTFEFFTESFLEKAATVATAKQHASNGLVRQNVAANENAIGYVSLGYVDSSVKAPAMDGVVPSVANCKNGTYHHVRPFNMCTKGDPTGFAKYFLDFVLSPQGQAIVAKEYLTVK